MSRITPDDRDALNALLDGELPPSQAAALEARLVREPELRAARDEIAAVRAGLRALPRPEVSADFLSRIDAIAGATKSPATATAPSPRPWYAGWQNLAAAMLVTALIASGSTYLITAASQPGFEQLVADAHRRSLLAESPVDVLSSDRHTVKPWLDQRLGVSPPAPDFAAQGYALVGGRVEVLGGKPLPVLVYRHNEHTISVIAQPASTATVAPVAVASGGYNMVEWSGGGFAFIAVSDLEAGELMGFVADYLASQAAP